MSAYTPTEEGMEVDMTKTGLGRSPSVNQKIHYISGENAPEVVPPGQYSEYMAPAYGGEVAEGATEGGGKAGTICGMRKKVFWILLGILALVVIVVVVVVAVVVTKNNSSGSSTSSTDSSLGSGSSSSSSSSTTTSTTSADPPSATVLGDTISDGSGFAAVKSGDSMQYFYQTVNGSLFYKIQTGEKITGGPSIVPGLTGAKSGTPLATVSWDDGASIRMYYLNSDNEIMEHAYENSTGWYVGSLSSEGIRAVDSSRLAAIKYGSALELRLYFQVSGGVIQEYTWKNGAWAISQSLPVGLTGTGLAALYYPGDNIRVYYQSNATTKIIREISYGWPDLTGWGETGFGPERKAAATVGSIAAVSWGDTSDWQMRVFYHPVDSPSSIATWAWKNTTWVGPTTLVSDTTLDNGAISAMSPAVNQYRIVYQDSTNSSTDLLVQE